MVLHFESEWDWPVVFLQVVSLKHHVRSSGSLTFRKCLRSMLISNVVLCGAALALFSIRQNTAILMG